MLAKYANFSFVVLTFGLTLAIYFAFRYQIDFWWLNFWYSLPSFGKLARLSKDATRSSNPGWLCGEETLCGDYRTHITTTSEAEFYKRLIYMRKAQDRGRKPLPGWMVAILRSEEHTSELQSQSNLVCRLLLEKKKTNARRALAPAFGIYRRHLRPLLRNSLHRPRARQASRRCWSFTAPPLPVGVRTLHTHEPD